MYIYIYIYIYICNHGNWKQCMETMCPPGYHHNGFVTTHVPKCMTCHKAIVVITGRANCFHDYIYISSILLL